MQHRMQSRRKGWRTAAIIALLATCQIALTGCRSPVLYTAHPQVLIERRAGGYAQLADDDPRYEHWEAHLANDPPLARLFQSFESTTAAFAAARLRSPARVAVVNRAVVVLGVDEGLLRDVPVQGVYGDVTIEFALGVPVADPADLPTAAPALARAIGQALMLLAGRELAAADDLLVRSLGAALEAWYISESAAPPATLADETDSASEVGPCSEAACLFMQQLMAAPVSGYPQRYMLWFANYRAQDEALAKVLLAANRVRREATIEDLANAYATAFPAERERVARLLAEMSGSRGAPAAGNSQGER